jgi:LuxR family maltose regulon positive regulatory protein
MPKAAADAVIWSPEREQYEWQHQGENNSCPVSAEDECGFLRLVDGSSSFAFQGRHGHLTLRKESRRHGEGYWYAYRSQGHRTRKKYLGRTPDLTIARLEDIAEALSAEHRVSTDERSQVKGETIPVPAVVLGEERGAALQRQFPDADTTSPTRPHLPVLVPKLQLPRLRASLLTRERLLRRLDMGLEGKLTLLSAPAGFGKTTVVSQWIAQQQKRQPHPSVAWLSLDAGDNDPIRFWSYVMLACQAFQAERDPSAPALLRTRSSFGSSLLEPMLRTFLNELPPLRHRGILVLEDYHVITEPEIHESMTFVLDHLPAMLHLVILSRVDPPLPLARWRAHGDLCEVRADDLRFSEEETASLLRQSLPEVLSSEQIHTLDRRLEGWVTGLHLVTLALQRRLSQPEVEQSLSTFSGSQRHLFSFFVSEVLSTQPEPIQLFLLQTSVLSRFCASLCDAVTASQGSERMLQAVEEANLFLSSLDGSGQWYRYHQLFAEAMQYEARQRLGEEALCVWYSRASRWYEQEHLLSEAVEMALCAQDFSRAATLMEKSLRPHHTYKEMKEYHTLRRWLSSLPEDVLRRHPRLCARIALLLTASGGGYSDDRPARLAQAEHWLQRAEGAWQADSNRSGLGEIHTIRAFLSWKQGDVARASHFAREALVLLPEGESQWRGSCLRIIGEEAMLSGQVREASQHFLEALALFDAAGNRAGAQAVQLALAEVYRLQGALRQAAELYRAVEAATEDLPKAGRAQLGLAQLSYGWNDLARAEQEAQRALAVGTQLADETLQAQASLILAEIELAWGQTAAAQKRLHALFARLSRVLMHSPLLHRHLLARQARLSLAVGDLAAVERWLLSSAEQETLPLLHQEQEALLSLRLLLARGEAEGVIRRLRRWQALAHQQERLRSEVEILVLRALAFFAREDRPRAFSLLRQALSLAQAEGEQRLFLDEGEKMVVLLRTALPAISIGLSEAYVQSLLNAFAQQRLQQKTSGASSVAVSSPLIEHLSSQERRVLGLLVAGCSNPEIAQALVVSINTVKTQVRSIYQKLNVKSRKEVRAIMRSQTVL